MHRKLAAAALAAALLAPPAAEAQGPRITAAEIDAHLRFLSSDLLEGRAPATRGDRLTTAYLSAVLQAAGVEPAGTDGYLQRVPIDVVGAVRESIRVRAGGRAEGDLRYPEEVVVWAGSAVPRSEAAAEIVFAGYGAHAPEHRWDDFEGMNMRGKILMVLVNDPPATPEEPELFGGAAMTYYGRWTYKFEEAERRGAAGMLIVHTTEAAGYPWHTVVGSWGREQRMLPRDEALPPPLGFRGWITDEAAGALLARAGLDLAELRGRAATRAFRPVPTGITLEVAFDNRIEHLESHNVVGVVRGSDPALRGQHVAFSVHWDHLGIGPAVDGDSIYNGAYDNASGVANILAVARSAAQGPAPRRSLLFVFVTAEESGLLGSEHFARNPTVPLDGIVANLNVDGGNLLGRSRDFRVLGDTKSTLGPAFAAMIAPRGWRISPDAHPERGYFYRSDHFSFAKAGVPAVSIAAGVDFEGRPEGWGVERMNEYTARHYHQPSDEYRPDFDLSGAVQLAEAVLEFGRLLADGEGVPEWSPGAEFGRR
jgi:Zn-dependent M28 family amino/carboxypeptidase